MLALGGKKSLELLSIVVPCFNEEATIPIFFKTVERIRGQIQADIEYCFVDDGSKDGTLAILRVLYGIVIKIEEYACHYTACLL